MESENNSQPDNEVNATETPEVVVEVLAEEYSQPSINPQDARRRLNQLLSIPDRDRSDEEWDELNELEIQFAPGNRVGSDQGGHFRAMNDKQGRSQQRGPQQGGKPKQFQQKSKPQGQGQGQERGGNPNHSQPPRQNNSNGEGGGQGQGQHKQRRQKPHRNRQQGGQNNQAQGEGGGSPAPAPQASEGPKSE